MDRRTPGMSLIELLVVVVIAGTMLAAVTQLLVVQQRGYRQEMAITRARQTARTSLEFLATELRELSATGGDILSATETSLEIRALRKLGFVCESTSPYVGVWQVGYPFAPDADPEPVLVYSGATDSWVEAEVKKEQGTPSCPHWDGATAARLLITPPINAELGSPIRGYETLIYGLYEIDGASVVGRLAPGDPAPVALLGPVADGDGLRFQYFDENDNPFSPNSPQDRARIRRIRIEVKAVEIGGSMSQRDYIETLATDVRLRGNAS